MQVPYLLDTKIKVTFDGITLNTDRQLIAGKLVTTYDKLEENVVDFSDELKKVVSIKDIEFDKTTKEVLIKSYNKTEKINLSKQKNGSIVVKDEKGKEYEVVLTPNQENVEVYALDRGDLAKKDTIDSRYFTEKDVDFQRKLIEELKKDIKEKLKPNDFQNEERGYVEGALRHLDFLKIENIVFKMSIGVITTGSYTGKLNVEYPEKSSKDDIKITLFHEYLHHVNYMEKIFVYRYTNEALRQIYFEMDDCYTFKEPTIEDVYNDYLIEKQLSSDDWVKNHFNELDSDKKKIILKFKEDNKENYTQKCHYGQYKPSNYFRDEYTIYSICLKEENNLFKASEMKLKNYKEMKDNYSEAINTSTHYEKKKNYDSTGFKK